MLRLTDLNTTPECDSHWDANKAKLEAARDAGELNHIPTKEFPSCVVRVSPDGTLYGPVYFKTQRAAAEFCTGYVGTVVIGLALTFGDGH
jgi:hypothetical protein